MRAGQDVGRLQIRRARRGLVALLELHEAGDRVDDVGEGRPRAPGAGLTEARDRAIDDVRLQGAKRRVVAVEPRHDPGHEVLDDYVGHLRQILDDGLAFGSREVDADALLARVHPGEIAALVTSAGLELQVVPPHLVALALTFDLDHAGAEVAEQARAIGSGQDTGQIQDGDADQRQLFGIHESSRFTGRVTEFYGPAEARVKPA